MRFRKLRIAWSVVWGVAAALFVVLWVRSYLYSDSIAIARLSSRRSLAVNSVRGRLAVHLTPTPDWWNSVKQRRIFVPGRGYAIEGARGYFDADGHPLEFRFPELPAKNHAWQVSSELLDDSLANQNEIVVVKLVNHWGFGRGIYSYVVPHWFAVAIVALLAGACWVRQLQWRFTLRTLLITMTLVTLVLGLIAAVV
jgi:hypothetical protein